MSMNSQFGFRFRKKNQKKCSKLKRGWIAVYKTHLLKLVRNINLVKEIKGTRRKE